MKKDVPFCQQKTDSYKFHYTGAATWADKQIENFWPWSEYNVSKDKHDLRTNMSEAELHGITTTLKLFTIYEVVAGSEYWGGRFKRIFPRPEFQRMAAAFADTELNSHAPFYDQANVALGLDNDEFYTSYADDPLLVERMEFIDGIVSDKDDLVSLAGFSIVEGAILYSNFAFLKHFQANGKNKVTNVVAGINQSVLDENLHSMGGAWAFKTLLGETPDADIDSIEDKMVELCDVTLEHESRIIQMLFEKGPITGVTEKQLVHFVQSRLNVCMEQLGFKPPYKVTYNPIAKWFYQNIGGGQFHDFFVKVGSEYKRGWIKSNFKWIPKEEWIHG